MSLKKKKGEKREEDVFYHLNVYTSVLDLWFACIYIHSQDLF